MQQNKKIRILLVDDHPLVRSGIKSELLQEDKFEVIGEATDGREAIHMAVKMKPDIILLDITMPGMTGFQALTVLKRKVPSSKIIAVTMHNSEDYIKEMFRLGAKGFFIKDDSPEELHNTIFCVAAGNEHFGKSDPILRKRDFLKCPPSNVLRKLTRREKEIFDLLSHGKNNKVIADELFISVRTVESHRLSIMKKLEVRSISDLTRFAMNNDKLS